MNSSLGRNAGLWLLAIVVSTTASVGQPAPYRGNLEDFETGIPDGEYNVVFSAWSEEAGGELLWQEEHDAVRIEEGRFLVLLGAKIPPLQDSSELWLELEVAGYLLWPRVRFPLSSNSAVQVAGDIRLSAPPSAPANLVGGIGWFFDDFSLQVGGAAGSNLTLTNFSAGDILLSTGTSVGSAQSVLNIKSSGRVGINTFFPRGQLDVGGRTYISDGSDASLLDGSGYLVVGDENGLNLVLDDNDLMARNNGAISTLFLQQNGGAVFVNGTQAHASDSRLKSDVHGLEYGLAEILRLRPVSFAWKTGGGTRRLGLIAQEAGEVIGEVILEGHDGLLGIAYADLVPVLIHAIQEQQAQIGRLESDLESLREESRASTSREHP